MQALIFDLADIDASLAALGVGPDTVVVSSIAQDLLGDAALSSRTSRP